MKQIITSLCLGSIAFAVPVLAQHHDESVAVPASAAHAHAAAHRQASNFEPIRAGGNVAGTRFRTQNYAPSNRVAVRNAETLPRHRMRNATGFSRNDNVVVNRTNNVNINRTRNVAVTNNWRSGRFSGGQYAAFRNYHRAYHDHGWWRSHYNNIVFVDGGWYFWDAGYWYPAWGYDPTAYYPYDGPIYGYNQLAPDRVIGDVQTQLQQDGYYSGPIDGVLGPQTRAAIAAFQADHGLAITSAVDEPTLATMGLT